MQFFILNARDFNVKTATDVSRQRGATLVEIILYLAVAAIVIFAVFSLFGSAFGGGKSQSEQTQMQGIISSVNSMYGVTKQYPTGNMTPQLVASKAMPSSMVIPGDSTTLRNGFGGNVTVTGIGTGYNILTTRLPRRACVELAQVGMGSTAFSINGNFVGNPASTVEAQNNCGDSNDMSWNFN